MTGTNLFAFYGSLRRGMQNFKAFQPQLKYLKTTSIVGFELYALDEYPYAVKTGNSSHSVVVEIFRIDDLKAIENIHHMELDAGYIFDLIKVDGQKVGIYLFEQTGDNSKVESGDWVQFFGGDQ